MRFLYKPLSILSAESGLALNRNYSLTRLFTTESTYEEDERLKGLLESMTGERTDNTNNDLSSGRIPIKRCGEAQPETQSLTLDVADDEQSRFKRDEDEIH